ncbi:MAG: hypothetical protein ACYTEQ_09335 [Planctomycetota bacterium]|jgi:hypothetical protein
MDLIQKEATIRLALFRKQAAKADAPNYKAMDKLSGKACATCALLDPDTGFCQPYNFKVNPDYVCDSYQPGNGVGVPQETFDKKAGTYNSVRQALGLGTGEERLDKSRQARELAEAGAKQMGTTGAGIGEASAGSDYLRKLIKNRKPGESLQSVMARFSSGGFLD